MLITPHVLVGGALGSLVSTTNEGRIIGFAAGLVSHYLLDAVPHWERLFGPKDNSSIRNIPASKWPAHVFVQAAIDVFVGFALLLVLAEGYSRSLWSSSPVFWAGLGAALPDLIDNVPFWKHKTRTIPVLSLLEKLHRAAHIKSESQKKLPKYTGLYTQILCIALAIFALTR
jgi:hypothetical protein